MYPCRTLPCAVCQAGVSPQVSTGGGGADRDWGTDSGESKAPQITILLGFRPLYFGNIGKSENFDKYSDNFLWKS